MINAISEYFKVVLDFFFNFTGNWGIAIILFAAAVKLLLWIPTKKQYESMRDMQRLQPEITKLQKLYKDDPQKQQTEVMKLYRDYKINPLGGCLPLLIQMPILIALWTTLNTYRSLFQRHYPDPLIRYEEWGSLYNFQFDFSSINFLWIGSTVSEKFPQIFAVDLGSKDLLLVLIYGFSMYLSQKLTPTPASDPAQAQSQKMMLFMFPVMTTVMVWVWNFSSALILYWLVFNVFSIIHQHHVMKELEANPLPPICSDEQTKTEKVEGDSEKAKGSVSSVLKKKKKKKKGKK